MSQSLGRFDSSAADKQRAVQSIYLPLNPWISNALILWGSPGPCHHQALQGWMDEDGDSSGDSQVWAVATAQHIPTPGAAQQDHLLLLLGVPRVNCRCFLPSKHKLISGLQAVLLQGSCQSLMEADQDTCDTHHWELLQLYLCHSPETGEHRDCLRKTGNFRKGVLENAAKHLLSLSFP